MGTVCAVAVVLFAFLFRLGYQAGTTVDDPMRTDAGQYTSIGWNILHHGVVSLSPPERTPPLPDSYRGPGYPLLVAASMLMGGDTGWYRYLLLMQAALGALSVALVIATARLWMPWAGAVVAGALVAVWPHMVTLSGYILTETFFGFSLVLGIYLLCSAARKRRPYQYALAGLTFGYAALINPVILFFPVLAGLVLFSAQRKHALLFLVCALSIPLAWSLRGFTIDAAHKASSSERLMENILIGMEPDFDSYYLGDPAGHAAKNRLMEGMAKYRQDPAAELGAVFSRLSEKPAFYAQWYLLQKPVRFWQWSIGQGAGDIYVYPVLSSPFETHALYRGIASVCHGLNLLLMLAAFGLVIVVTLKAVRGGLKEHDMPLVFVTLLFVYATLLHSVLAPDARYATPFRPMEIMLALSLLALGQQKWKESRLSTKTATPA